MKSQTEITGLWAKSEPRQSLLGHMLIVGVVCKELLTNSVFRPSLSLLAKLLNVSQDEAAAFASYVASLHDIGKSHPTIEQNGPLIVFYAPADIDAVAEVVKQKIIECGDKKTFEKLTAKELQAAVGGADKRGVTLDIALFGRMVTSDAFADVDAAMQVAHAISTNRLTMEADFFTANITHRDCSVYILSKGIPGELPPGMTLAASRDITPVIESFSAGQTWRFDLVAQPCKKIAAEGQKNSRRVLLRTPEERLLWLETKGRTHGFSVIWSRESGHTTVYGEHETESGGKMFMTAVNFCGALVIEDAVAFRKAYCEGVGPGKAYGMGMLLLARG